MKQQTLLPPIPTGLLEPLLVLLMESADAPMLPALHIRPHLPLFSGTSHLDLLSQTILQVPICPASLSLPLLQD